jgi:hypothetical protein
LVEPGSSSTPAPDAPGERARPLPAGLPFAAALLAWLVPGLGHAVQRRWVRGLLFLALILVTLSIGCGLEGNLHRPVPGQPLSVWPPWAPWAWACRISSCAGAWATKGT